MANCCIYRSMFCFYFLSFNVVWATVLRWIKDKQSSHECLLIVVVANILKLISRFSERQMADRLPVIRVSAEIDRNRIEIAQHSQIAGSQLVLVNDDSSTDNPIRGRSLSIGSGTQYLKKAWSKINSAPAQNQLRQSRSASELVQRRWNINTLYNSAVNINAIIRTKLM